MRNKLSTAEKRKTIVKKELIKSFLEIEDAKTKVLDTFADALFNGDSKEKFAAAKELAKYLFPTKQNIQGNFDGKINIVFENIKN